MSNHHNPNHLILDAGEEKRLKKLTEFEDAARLQGHVWIAGVDEAGRGPLAGPVVAAACILPPGYFLAGINDSKQLTPARRLGFYQHLVNDPSVVYGVGVVDAEEIDRINIFQATIVAMKQAVSQLAKLPTWLLIDAMLLPGVAITQQSIVKGDEKSQSIAAASVIAKETRDDMMKKFHLKWPRYGFDQHKGYGTAAHLQAIRSFGLCPIHRRSFSPCAAVSQPL